MNKFFDKSRGQIAVLYAGIILVLVGAISLGADVAVMYANWQQTQKVADAAALAGANYLTGIAYNGTFAPGCTGDGATKVACTYAANNGLTTGVTVTEPSASTVKVVATQTGLPYFFGKVIGLNNYAVTASATANSPGPVDTVEQGLLPLGLQCATPCGAGSLVAGEPVSFGNKFVSSTINLAGNWDWLDLDGSGGSGMRTAIENGATTPYSAINADGTCSGPGSCTVNTKPGGTNGPVSQGISKRMKGCPSIPDPCTGGNPSSIPVGDPCLVVVPAVDFAAAAKAGKTSLTIEKFAEVYLDPTTTDGSHINGCYITSVVGNTLTGSTGSFGPTTPPVLIN